MDKIDKRYKFLIDNITDAIGVFDKNHKLIYFNKEFNSIMNKKILYGKKIDTLLFPNNKLFKNVLKNLMENNRWEGEMEIKNEVSPNRFYSVLIDRLQISHGKEKDLIVIFRDISKQKNTVSVLKKEQQISKLLASRQNTELQKTKKSLGLAKRLSDIGLITATIAHEMRNPLSTINAAVFNIKRKRTNKAIDNNIKTIEKKISEANSTIDNLLFYSGLKELDYSWVNISALIGTVIKSAKERFTDHDVEIIIKNENADGIKMYGDSIRLMVLFDNIINNSFQSLINNKGRIEIKINNSTSKYFLEFSDNGHGIDKKLIKKVLEPFFTTRSKGTGLGLAVCEQIISLHKGEMKIQSKIDKGTTVYITLPLK